MCIHLECEKRICAETRLLLSTHSESSADFEDVLVLLARSLVF